MLLGDSRLAPSQSPVCLLCSDQVAIITQIQSLNHMPFLVQFGTSHWCLRSLGAKSHASVISEFAFPGCTSFLNLLDLLSEMAYSYANPNGFGYNFETEPCHSQSHVHPMPWNRLMPSFWNAVLRFITTSFSNQEFKWSRTANPTGSETLWGASMEISFNHWHLFLTMIYTVMWSTKEMQYTVTVIYSFSWMPKTV